MVIGATQSLQLSQMTVSMFGPCSSNTGSASGFGTPEPARSGPIPRMVMCFGALPVMIKPAMPTSFPVPTSNRVERLRACAGGTGLDLVSELSSALESASESGSVSTEVA